jgi:hypothetical protein
MLFPIHQYLLYAGLAPTTTIQQLQWAHFALVALNISLAFYLGKKKGIEYLGQVNMLALITVLLTIPIITFNQYLQKAGATVNSFYLGMLAVVIINEYTRRMKFARIMPQYPLLVLINIFSVIAFVWYLIF